MEKDAAPAYDAPSMPAPHVQQMPMQQMPMQPVQPQVIYAQPTEAQVGAQYQAEMFARCARGDHEIRKRHGVFGIITAIVFFPIGLICFFTNTHRECRRCGAQLD